MFFAVVFLIIHTDTTPLRSQNRVVVVAVAIIQKSFRNGSLICSAVLKKTFEGGINMEVFMCSANEHKWICTNVKTPERFILGSVHINMEYHCSICGVFGVVDSLQIPRIR